MATTSTSTSSATPPGPATPTSEGHERIKTLVILTDVGTDTWREVLLLPYGETPQELGDGRALNEQFGPDLPAARDRNGDWWIADVYKDRVAVFNERGTLVAEYATDIRGPVFGIQILDDGRAIGASTEERVVVIGDQVDYFDVGLNLTLLDTDGAAAYGHITGTARNVVVRPSETGVEVETVRTFPTRAGSSYSVKVANDSSVVVVSIIDESGSSTIELQLSDGTGGTVFALAEAVAGPDGSVHLLLVGWSESDESNQLGRYVHLSSDGLLTDLPVPNPFGELDPGTPHHLVVDPVHSTPYIAVIDSDGVRIWSPRRSPTLPG